MQVIDQNYQIKIKSMDDIQLKFKKYKAFYAVAKDQGMIGDYSEVALIIATKSFVKETRYEP